MDKESTKKFLLREARSQISAYGCPAANLLRKFAKAYSAFESAESVGALRMKESDYPASVKAMSESLSSLENDGLEWAENWKSASKKVPFLREILDECRTSARSDGISVP